MSLDVPSLTDSISPSLINSNKRDRLIPVNFIAVETRTDSGAGSIA
jgi:hypothetical protein